MNPSAVVSSPRLPFGAPSDSQARVVEKALIDACVWAPIANGAYLGLTPLVEGAGLQRSGEVIQERFVEVMKTELKTFTPYNLVAFSLIPPLLRPFTTGFVSMCFGVYISYITHLTPEVEEPPAAEGVEVENASPLYLHAD
jgi:hypothetical protein